jgi:hypothetical protein
MYTGWDAERPYDCQVTPTVPVSKIQGSESSKLVRDGGIAVGGSEIEGTGEGRGVEVGMGVGS